MNIEHFVYDSLISAGMSELYAKYLNMIALFLAVLIIAVVIDFGIRKLLLRFFSQFADKSKSAFDNILIKNKVPRNVAHIVPLIIALEFAPIIFIDFQYAENILEKGLMVLGVILTLRIARSLLNSLKDYFKTLPRLKDKPIDSYIQVFMIFAWIVGILSSIAIITDIKFLTFFTTLGAASAVILLVFRDTILGFVASIQVAINDMVRIGDWITFDKYGADGDVIEINLSTVKVQNFDKTITTIPTYALISDSFRNWRGMESSGGRRIKRALNIKLNSVSFLSQNQIDELKNIELISSYLDTRMNDINAHNQEHNINKDTLINGRNLTNIGVFRKYLQEYVEQHAAVNKEMTIMVRQLAPTAQGIPIEIYAFSSDKRWENYEYIMADIFDHVIAAVPYFGLEIFELPTQSSFTDLSKV